LLSSGRRFGVSFGEGIVNPVVVVAVHVIANEPSQMLFVQRDDMVENLSAASFPPSVPQSRFAKVLEHSCASARGQ